MKQINIYPSYYKKFKCVAADCSDSCCAQWQIVVDDYTLQLYSEVQGELGEKLRSVQEIDEDGDCVFRLCKGKCPFWEKSGLCEIHRCLGEDYLCDTCREYPRAVQDYGDFAEHDLSLSCPEAAKIILSEDCLCEDTDEVVFDIPDEKITYNPCAMNMLKNAREIICGLIRNKRITVTEALAQSYFYSVKVQKALKNNEYGKVPLSLCRSYTPKDIQYTELIDSFLKMEILTDEWRKMLLEARKLGNTSLYSTEYADALQAMDSFDTAYRNMLIHYMYRYWLRAAFDRDVMGKTDKMITAYAVLRRMQTAYYVKNKELPFSASVRMVQLYSKEIEHNGDEFYFF